MKRIALLLAAVGLGSGCVVDTCDNQTLTVDWAFVAADGTYYADCSAAGVDYVDVWVDNLAYRADCFDGGVTLFDVPSGVHDVVVEGIYGGTINSGGLIVNRDWRTNMGIASCGDTYFPADPGEGDLVIDYSFSPAGCGASTYMWYSLIDETLNATAHDTVTGAATLVSSGTSLPCTTSTIAFTLPYGQYTLDWISEVTSDGTVQAQSCGPVSAYVPNPILGTTVHLPVTLAVDPLTCP